MTYDFTSIMNREGKDALAVDIIPFKGAEIKEGFSKIPMWVADMNFPTAPSVTEAIIERAKHPAFGYFIPPDAYFDSIISWQKRRFNRTDLEKKHISYENGVLGGVISAMNILSSKGDSVLVHSPTYIGFTHVLENNGYNIVHSPLKKDENGIWRMDYEDMKGKLEENHIHVAIFCTPHNPTGRVWEKWEIEKALDVYQAANCMVISDEIWADIILEDYKHIPTQTISEEAKKRTIAIYAPSKTFNLAGLIGSYHIIYNDYLRERYKKESSLSHYNNPNVLSVHALIGAYKPEGELWVDELCQVISENVDYACSFIQEKFQGVKVSKPQGTYMLFLDCKEWCENNSKSMDDLIKAGIEVGVIWQDGRPFHDPYAIRMNVALPKSLVEEAFKRLEAYVF